MNCQDSREEDVQKYHGRSVTSSFPKSGEKGPSHHRADDSSILSYFLPTLCEPLGRLSHAALRTLSEQGLANDL